MLFLLLAPALDMGRQVLVNVERKAPFRKKISLTSDRCWPLQGINRSATWCSFTRDTFRAFIKIKSLLADGRALFDVAVAGPLTWLVFAISALLIGLRFSVVIRGNGGSSLD